MAQKKNKLHWCWQRGSSLAFPMVIQGGSLDATGPFRHNSFIWYLARNQRSFTVIREDGLHVHQGTDEPLPEPAQPDRPPTYMHQREGRWYFNDANNDSDDDDDF